MDFADLNLPDDPMQVVLKRFRDLKQGDLVLMPNGVVESIIGEPREQGTGWSVGVSGSATIGPLTTSFAHAYLVTFRPAGFMSGMNL